MDQIKRKLNRQLEELYKEGADVLLAEHRRKKPDPKGATAGTAPKSEQDLRFEYQHWYSKALPVVHQLLPERYREFQDQYKLERKEDSEIDSLTCTISDYLEELSVPAGGPGTVDTFSAFVSKFRRQLTILASASESIESILSDIEGVLKSKLSVHELEADDLESVSLETYLARACANHEVTINKNEPTIADFNDALKSAGVLDAPTWRYVQRLAEIRNICVHAEDREPTLDELIDLLVETREILGTGF